MATKKDTTTQPAAQTAAATEPQAMPEIPLPTSGGCWVRSADGLRWERDPTAHPPALSDANPDATQE